MANNEEDDNITPDAAVNSPEPALDGSRVEQADNDGISTRPNADSFQDADEAADSFPTLDEAEKEIAKLLSSKGRPRDVASKFAKQGDLNFNLIKSYYSKQGSSSAHTTKMPAWFTRNLEVTSLLKISEFQRTVQTKYMRKNLSLAYQRTYFLKDMKRSLRDIGDILSRKEDAIKVNTGITAKSTLTEDAVIDDTLITKFRKELFSKGKNVIGKILSGKSLKDLVTDSESSVKDKLSILEPFSGADNKLGRLSGKILDKPKSLFEKIGSKSAWFDEESKAQKSVSTITEMFNDFAPQWLKDKFGITKDGKDDTTLKWSGAYKDFLTGWKNEQLELLRDFNDKDFTSYYTDPTSPLSPQPNSARGYRPRTFREDFLEPTSANDNLNSGNDNDIGIVDHPSYNDDELLLDNPIEKKKKEEKEKLTLASLEMPVEKMKSYWDDLRDVDRKVDKLVANNNNNVARTKEDATATTASLSHVKDIIAPVTSPITAVSPTTKPPETLKEGITASGIITEAQNQVAKEKDYLEKAKELIASPIQPNRVKDTLTIPNPLDNIEIGKPKASFWDSIKDTLASSKESLRDSKLKDKLKDLHLQDRAKSAVSSLSDKFSSLRKPKEEVLELTHPVPKPNNDILDLVNAIPKEDSSFKVDDLKSKLSGILEGERVKPIKEKLSDIKTPNFFSRVSDLLGTKPKEEEEHTSGILNKILGALPAAGATALAAKHLSKKPDEDTLELNNPIREKDVLDLKNPYVRTEEDKQKEREADSKGKEGKAYSFFGELKRRAEAAGGGKAGGVPDVHTPGSHLPGAGTLWNIAKFLGADVLLGGAIAAATRSRPGRLLNLFRKRGVKSVYNAFKEGSLKDSVLELTHGKTAGGVLRQGVSGLGSGLRAAGHKLWDLGKLGFGSAFEKGGGVLEKHVGDSTVKELLKSGAKSARSKGLKAITEINKAPVKLAWGGLKNIGRGLKYAATEKVGSRTLLGHGLHGLWEGTKFVGRNSWDLGTIPIKMLGGALYSGAKHAITKAPKAIWTTGKNLVTSPFRTLSKGVMGGGLKGLLKGSLGGIAGGIALDVADSQLDKHTRKGSAANVFGHTATRAGNWALNGATIGSIAGSIIPVVGNAAGAAVGAGLGAVAGAGYELAHHLTEIKSGFKSFSDDQWGKKPKYDAKGNLIPDPNSTMGRIQAGLDSSANSLSSNNSNVITNTSNNNGVKQDNGSSNDSNTNTVSNGAGTGVQPNPSPTAVTMGLAPPTTASNPVTYGGPSSSSSASSGGPIQQANTPTDLTQSKEYKDTFKALPKEIQDRVNKSPNFALKYTVWTTGVQYGSKQAADIITEVYKSRANQSDKDLIDNIFQKRATTMSSIPMMNNASASLANAKQEKMAQDISSGAAKPDYQSMLSSTGGKGGVSISVAKGGDQSTRGLRNNNPGDLGFVGQKYATRELMNGKPSRFAHFASMADGIREMRNQLERYQTRTTANYDHLQTVRGIISTWSPPKENDTEGYIREVCHNLGVSDTQPLGILSNQAAAELIKQIMLKEQGPGVRKYWPMVDNILAAANGHHHIPLTGDESIQQLSRIEEESGDPWNPTNTDPDNSWARKHAGKNKGKAGDRGVAKANSVPPVSVSSSSPPQQASGAPTGTSSTAVTMPIAASSSGDASGGSSDGSAPVSDGGIHSLQDWMNAGIGTLGTGSPSTVPPVSSSATTPLAADGSPSSAPSVAAPRTVTSPPKVDNAPKQEQPKPANGSNSKKANDGRSHEHIQRTSSNTSTMVQLLTDIKNKLSFSQSQPANVTVQTVNGGHTTIAPSVTDHLSLRNGHDGKANIG